MTAASWEGLISVGRLKRSVDKLARKSHEEVKKKCTVVSLGNNCLFDFNEADFHYSKDQEQFI